jgi:hypothetical protein
MFALGIALFARAPEAGANEVATDVAPSSSPPIVVAQTETKLALTASASDLVAPPVPYDRWRGLSFGTYLAPKSDFIAKDGGVDVVFHFHAGQMAERQMKESGMNAVFVSCGYGIGSGAYAAALADPQRFDRMIAELVKNLESQTGRRDVHVRHLALASWSAGFAAIGKILSVDRYFAMTDTVILNDSLHSPYVGPNPTVNGYSTKRGADRVDLKMMRHFIRFAKEAAAGRKTMAITHSSIVPPDYASSTEATEALLTAIGVPSTVLDEPGSRGMTLIKRADQGNLHVRGFRGRGPHDHFDHLYLIGEALRSWVVPRWKREERLVYTLAGEQL